MRKIKGGYYIKARKIQDSEIAIAPPCTREVWDYIIKEANHDTRYYRGYKVNRGQLFRSYSDIREALKWKVGYRTMRYTKDQIKGAMKTLTNASMTTPMKTPRGMLITVHKYDFYQDPKNYEATNEAPNEDRLEPLPLTRTKEIRKNNISSNEKKTTKISKRIVDKLIEIQKISKPDKSYTLNNLYPAKRLADVIAKNLETKSGHAPTDDEILADFEYIMNNMDEFNYNNATNVGYIENNYNQINNKLRK